MRLKLIIGIVIFCAVILGFAIGAGIPDGAGGCTEMACPCEGVSGERPCNHCSTSDPIFMTGIVNVIQQCGATEMIQCENNIQVGSRIDKENGTCRTDWYVFGYNLRYLGTNPDEPVSTGRGY